MQNRMKTHPLDGGEMEALLERAEVAVLATLGADGAPYAVPVHFAWAGGKFYIHGLPAGEKVENILRDGRACLTAYDMEGLLLPEEERPCDVNTAYESVVVKGRAVLVSDREEKELALRAIVAKYTPQMTAAALPENMVAGTAVIRLDVAEMTGKYYR